MTDSSTTSRGSAIDAELAPGTTVGEYVIARKLGQGGFGAVYQATHPLIGKLVAIKVLAHRFSVDPEMVERFISEARAVIQIKHRNIIDIFSFGELPDGRRYYVMEYLDGEPLDAHFERHGRLSLAEALPILRAVARALDAAHAKGIAHRDLKPENVFLGRDEDGNVYPKLLDFGVAKLLHPDEGMKSKTRTGVPIGTPYFMSPEQCRGRDVDHRTDFYAFGVMTYLLLTGVYPIEGDDYMTILMRQMTEQPAPASSVVSELPVGIDDVIAELMNKDPARRPPKLAAAIRALEQVAEQNGIAVPGGTTPAPGELSSITPSSLPRTSSARSRVTPGIANALASAQTQPAMVTPEIPSTAPRIAGATSTIGEDPRRSRWPIVAGIVVVAAAAAVIAVTMSSNKSSPSAAASGSAVSGSSSGAAGSAAAPPPAGSAAAQQPVEPAGSAAGSATPSPPSTATIQLAGSPSGTVVMLGKRKLGTVPGMIELPAGEPVELRFEKRGYVTKSMRVVPGEQPALDVKLERAKTTRPSGDDTGDPDLLDPFGKKGSKQ